METDYTGDVNKLLEALEKIGKIANEGHAHVEMTDILMTAHEAISVYKTGYPRKIS